MARPALSVYLLRARDIQNTFTQPLLNRTNEPNSDLDSTVQTDTISKPVNKITIRIKSGDSTIESGTDDERSVIVQEDPLASCIHNHQCLSPSKRSAKALIYFLYLVDLAIGIYLAVRSLQNQNEDDYGIIMMSLTAGLLLIGGSLAGICLHTPLGALLCNGDMDANRSLMIFNTSFAFIGVGIYYLIGLSLLVSPLFNKSLDESNNSQLSLQCIKSVAVFILSILEGYRVLFIHYHHHHPDQNRTADSQTSRPLAIV